jgi:hypothetical protein
MTTILVINAVSSLLAGIGFLGFSMRQYRRVRRDADVQALYVTSTTRRPARA